MNAYVFEVNGNAEQPEVLAKKFNGDSNGPDTNDKILSSDSASCVIAFINKTKQILQEIEGEDCTNGIFLTGSSSTELSHEQVGQLIEHGKAILSTSTKESRTKYETPYAAACDIASLFTTYLHSFLCILMGRISDILDGFNKDQNNKTSKSEEDQIQLQPTKIGEEQILNTFKIVDADGNGFISKDELDELNDILAELRATLTILTELKQAITKVDTDGDGISYEEFAVMMRNKVSKP